MKESSVKNGPEYVDAKTMINSAYGRFGLAPEGDDTLLVWDDELDDWNWTQVFNPDTQMESYIPFAVFVTAWARRHLLDNVKACMETYGMDSVIHCDTDSVIHYGEPIERENVVHGEHVSTWGIESRPEYIIEGGFKRYMEFSRYPMERMEDLIGMACAGVPQHMDHDDRYPIGMWVELLDKPMRIMSDGYELGHEHYKIVSEWLRELYIKYGQNPDDVDTRKLIPKKVPGGVVLEPRSHKLNDNLMWRLRR